MSVRIAWADATFEWGGPAEPGTAVLTVEAEIPEYTAAILETELPRALGTIANGDSHWTAIVRAGRMDSSGESVEPGAIVISSERFLETFNARELRERVQVVVDSAYEQGDHLYQEDLARARAFLDELAG